MRMVSFWKILDALKFIGEHKEDIVGRAQTPQLPKEARGVPDKLVQEVRHTKLQNMLVHIPTYSGVDTPDDIVRNFMVLQSMEATLDHDLVVVELGSYEGRHSVPLCSAFMHRPHRFFMVDYKNPLIGRDPDSLQPLWKEFQKHDVRSGVDTPALVTHALSKHGFLEKTNETNIQVCYGRVQKLGETFQAWAGEETKIDYLIVNNVWNYKDLLDISNAWFKWLRLGGMVCFMDAARPEVDAVVRELILQRKWFTSQQMQGTSGSRLWRNILRPLDETSGRHEELEDMEGEELEDANRGQAE